MKDSELDKVAAKHMREELEREWKAIHQQFPLFTFAYLLENGTIDPNKQLRQASRVVVDMGIVLGQLTKKYKTSDLVASISVCFDAMRHLQRGGRGSEVASDYMDACMRRHNARTGG